MDEIQDGNQAAKKAWNANAQFWDQRMGEGNDFFNILIWPAVEQLLGVKKGERILDIACGNGLTSRRMAEAGADVLACDFAENLIELAKERSQAYRIDYRIVDATDYDAMVALGESTFDGALCNMAFMDLADIHPAMRALAKLLRPGGRFVFSLLHPCFNNPSIVQMGEMETRDGELVTTYSVKVPRYMTPFTQKGVAMRGQPEPHPYFHLPLGQLLGAGFEAGFVVDGFVERAFQAEDLRGQNPLSWNGNFNEIPPVLVVRMRMG